MYYVYILRNTKNQMYVGSASNIDKRLHRHNSGEGAEFTKRNKNFSIVFKECFNKLVEARRREKQIKGWRREKKENLIKYNRPLI
jgi:predicted GIY-YIG superfamily endonuclease